jgi:hypothetical protein
MGKFSFICTWFRINSILIRDIVIRKNTNSIDVYLVCVLILGSILLGGSSCLVGGVSGAFGQKNIIDTLNQCLLILGISLFGGNPSFSLMMGCALYIYMYIV